MIDYLAKAMEQEGPTDREVAPSLRKAGIGTTLLPAGERDASLSGRGNGQRASGGEEAPVPRRQARTAEPGAVGSRADGSAEAPTGARRVVPLLEGAVRLSGGAAVPALSGAPLLRDREVSPPMLRDLRRAGAGADFIRRERRALSVTLPEVPAVAGSLSAEELDRTVERDARRYDGGLTLY